MPDLRREQLEKWIACEFTKIQPQLTTVSGDASFRRYFRFFYQNQSYIAVDAPPEHEDNLAFSSIGNLLKQHNILVPDFLATNYEKGFLIISDLGDQLLLPLLNEKNVDSIYEKAMEIIFKLQLIPNESLNHLPNYNRKKLTEELNLFNQWFLKTHLQINITTEEKALILDTFELLIQSAIQQPQKFVHRDFHSRNLMLVNDKIAVIDFQDAVVGAITYDLVSLLKDCYIVWSEEKVKQWINQFFLKAEKKNLLTCDFKNFYKDFEWMGMQRHIKVLGIFARLNYRDKKPEYLNDLPLTFNYLIKATSRYSEFNNFRQFLIEKVKPKMNSLKMDNVKMDNQKS